VAIIRQSGKYPSLSILERLPRYVDACVDKKKNRCWLLGGRSTADRIKAAHGYCCRCALNVTQHAALQCGRKAGSRGRPIGPTWHAASLREAGPGRLWAKWAVPDHKLPWVGAINARNLLATCFYVVAKWTNYCNWIGGLSILLFARRHYPILFSAIGYFWTLTFCFDLYTIKYQNIFFYMIEYKRSCQGRTKK
jgi:hypothetical protein